MSAKPEKKRKKILSELEKIAFCDAEDSDVKLNYRLKALELLGKHLGLFDAEPLPEASDDGLLEAIISAASLWKEKSE